MAITLKLGSGGLWFLCSALLLNEIYIPLKFHVQICNSLWDIAPTSLWLMDGHPNIVALFGSASTFIHIIMYPWLQIIQVAGDCSCSRNTSSLIKWAYGSCVWGKILNAVYHCQMLLNFKTQMLQLSHTWAVNFIPFSMRNSLCSTSIMFEINNNIVKLVFYVYH